MSKSDNPAGPIYKFRCNGKSLKQRTLEQFRQDPFISDAKARKLEACEVGTDDWVPLSALVDLSGDWRIPPGMRLIDFERLAQEQRGSGASNATSTADNMVPVLLVILSILGIAVIGGACTMDTSVRATSGEMVYNLSKGQNQTVVLILGVSAAAVGVLGMVIRSSLKK